MEHFCVKFGDPSYIGVRDIVLKNRQTDRQTLLKTVPLQLPSAWVMKLHGLCVCVCGRHERVKCCCIVIAGSVCCCGIICRGVMCVNC